MIISEEMTKTATVVFQAYHSLICKFEIYAEKWSF